MTWLRIESSGDVSAHVYQCVCVFVYLFIAVVVVCSTVWVGNIG